MNKFYLVALILGMTLSACGVREEEPEGGTAQSATSSGNATSTSSSVGTSSTSTSTASSSGSNSGELANDEALEGGEVVKTQFVDAYTGFWEKESQSASQPNQILRISFGVSKFHMQRFYDQSSGSGALMQNCYIRESGSTQRTKSARGLWFTYETTDSKGEPITSDDGWSLNGVKLEYTKFLGDEQIESASSTYQKVFTGLPVDGLQICGDGS